jgi:hypothetical protein
MSYETLSIEHDGSSRARRGTSSSPSARTAWSRCSAPAGGGVTFADLTKPNPDFAEIPLAAVRDVNCDVARMIR